MKKLFTILFVFACLIMSAQESYWTNYTFIVEPENESVVFKLIDDYFKEHKTEGITVSLYANHFHDEENTATHMIVFAGSLDALGGMYASDGGDAWDLLGARLDHHIKDGSGARMGTMKKAYGDSAGDHPIQRYYILDVEDYAAFESSLTKYNTDHAPAGRAVMMGNITSGVSPEGENHWVIDGYKDFKGAIGGANAGLSDSDKAKRQADWKTFQDNNGGVRLVRSGLRVRLGQW
ncbi:hypothetical protein [Lutimonas sp.]|uniref:hypothetical protein n=1 Tax=Lutimonas sp. TaxID=1872403 RepID=UPI003D9BDC66